MLEQTWRLEPKATGPSELGGRRVSRPELRTEQKREKDAIDRGDVGRAGIFLFCRELFADSSVMESNGPDVPSNSLCHPVYDPG